MKNIKNFAWMLCALLCMTAFTACEDDTEDFYGISVGEMSDAFKENYLLQTCVGVALTDPMIEGVDGSEKLRTEKEAKQWFDSVCDKVKNSWTIVNTFVAIEPDTWLELQLVNSNNAVVKTKKVKFEVNKIE
ncbi:MAG: hypothetical protein IKM35_02650 [Bacteroidaceae bacterium]|nr:hypothetical protein [Bacteroidaceae bacterium]